MAFSDGRIVNAIAERGIHLLPYFDGGSGDFAASAGRVGHRRFGFHGVTSPIEGSTIYRADKVCPMADRWRYSPSDGNSQKETKGNGGIGPKVLPMS